MNSLDKQLNKITSRIDVEEFNRNAKEVFENEVIPQIKRSKEDNMTAVEWLVEQLSAHDLLNTRTGNSMRNLNNMMKIEELIEQAKEMEKENLESLKDFDTWKELKNKS